jgi:aryl sulfotransferase
VSSPRLVDHRSEDDDNGRWDGFEFRPGDIVISTRSKSGTTWMQMICALLVFQTPSLPAPLRDLSPWLDWRIAPRDEVFAQLAGQTHRRFIKTHTPLDGVPIDPRVTYIVVARHPLDMAVSLYHQRLNLDRERVRHLIGDRPPPTSSSAAPTTDVHQWLVDWIDWHGSPNQDLDSLPGVMWHLRDAWARRHQPNILLEHYDDLCADLEGQMRRVARQLDIVVDDSRWPELVLAAQFDQMQELAEQLAPGPPGVVIDPRRFFRRGRSGAGRELLSADELDRYRRRSAQLAPPDLLSWLHGEHPRPIRGHQIR